jgi:hypothetical protein
LQLAALHHRRGRNGDRRACAHGEVGLVAPNAATRHFDDGSALIVFNSGLIEFIRAVVFTIMAGVVVDIRESATATRMLEHQDAAMPHQAIHAGLLALYRQWGIMWSEGRFSFPDIQVKPEAAKIGQRLLDLAMLFLLFHECAHAVLHADVELNNRRPHHELEADRWGFEAIMRHVGLKRREANTTLAGAVMAIRSWAALEAIGHKFPTSYPRPSQRFAALVEAFRGRCDCEWTFYLGSEIAFSMDMRMEAVEKVYRGLPHLPDVTVDRFVSSVMSGLIATHQGRVTPDAIRRELQAWIPQHRLREVSKAAARIFTKAVPYYGETATSFGRQATYVVDTFGQLMKELRSVSGSAAKRGQYHA